LARIITSSSITPIISALIVNSVFRFSKVYLIFCA
jgi:hypothetical protein